MATRSSTDSSSCWVAGGVMTVTLVSGPEEFGAATRESDVLLAGYAFEAGSDYAAFIPGTDDVAKVGLAALVVGGAGAALLTVGFALFEN